jgi:hypothetical protein
MSGGSYRPLQPETRAVPCRSCAASIFFVRCVKTGKNIPCDVGAASDGNVVLREGSTREADVLGHDAAKAYPGKKYRSHFMTCPNATAWRRARGIAEPIPGEGTVQG